MKVSGLVPEERKGELSQCSLELEKSSTALAPYSRTFSVGAAAGVFFLILGHRFCERI